jgi:hypothetical protein
MLDITLRIHTRILLLDLCPKNNMRRYNDNNMTSWATFPETYAVDYDMIPRVLTGFNRHVKGLHTARAREHSCDYSRPNDVNGIAVQHTGGVDVHRRQIAAAWQVVSLLSSR